MWYCHTWTALYSLKLRQTHQNRDRYHFQYRFLPNYQFLNEQISHWASRFGRRRSWSLYQSFFCLFGSRTQLVSVGLFALKVRSWRFCLWSICVWLSREDRRVRWSCLLRQCLFGIFRCLLGFLRRVLWGIGQ